MLDLYIRLQSLLTVQRERGATAVEYGIFVALIAAVIVVLVRTLGTEIQGAFTTINNAL